MSEPDEVESQRLLLLEIGRRVEMLSGNLTKGQAYFQSMGEVQAALEVLRESIFLLDRYPANTASFLSVEASYTALFLPEIE